MKTVYLAGPITGCTYTSCTDWRKHVSDLLALAGITALDPMRGKTFLTDETSVGNNYQHPLGSPRGIMTRDHWDCTRCDVLLVNLLGATRVSIGTVMEIAWAWDNGIPVVVVMEPDGNPHDHAMIQEATGFRVSTMDNAVDLVRALLGEA
jgi:nucleoside 2-deoxyribosyltransferase